MTELSRGTAGFTLLELLVTMSLLGLLTMVMFGGMRFGVQVWARTGSDLTASNSLRKAENLIQRELSRAYPLYSSNGTTAQIAFDGEPHRIRYLAPSSDVPGAMDDVILEANGDGQSVTLVRTAKAELARSDEVHRSTLVSKIHSIAFSYFGAAQDGAKPEWSGDWRQKTRLPTLIRIMIVAADATHTFVVAPHLSADAGCSFDALTKNCRGR